MVTADQAVAIFDSFVGITENPVHSNRTPIGQEFGWNGVPWCAETCSVVLKRAFGRVILWTASVAQAIADAKSGNNGMRWHDRNAIIQKGWLVTYDFGGHGDSNSFHIAMVRDPGTQTKFQTDGGNEGDAVRQQWRDRTYVQGFIEIPYNTQPDTRSEEDDDMVRLFTHKGGAFIGVLGAWYRWIPTGGIQKFLERSGVKWNNTDNTAEVQDDVFNAMVDLGKINAIK